MAQNGVEKGAAVFCVAEIFDIEIFQHVMDLCIISTVKDRIISHGLAVQHWAVTANGNKSTWVPWQILPVQYKHTFGYEMLLNIVGILDSGMLFPVTI